MQMHSLFEMGLNRVSNFRGNSLVKEGEQEQNRFHLRCIMAKRTSRWVLSYGVAAGMFGAGLVSGGRLSQAQVFVVGEHTATAGIATDFTPTNFPLPDGKLSERGRRELIRNLEAEQGFAHRVLPMGAGLVLDANGPLSPGPEQYKKMIYEKGQSSGVGDRVAVTGLTIKPDRIIIDLNGGPYAKHRFLSHVSLNDAPVTQPQQQATGSRVTLVFKGGVPEISAPEVKALLTPVIDFGAKTSADAYADTLPGPVKESVLAHDVLVGMDRKMVLASVGAPESKVREHADGDPDGPRYEEWIYGHVPQTVKFVRFNGDRVVMVKICALGKPIEVHNQNEMGEYGPPPETREIAMGDKNPDDHEHPAPPPTLRGPGEKVPANANQTGRVQYPPPPKPAAADPADAKPVAAQPVPADTPAAGDAAHLMASSW